MINLLPPEFKTGYAYARRNVGLRKWVFVLVIVLLSLGALGTYGLLAMRQSQNDFSRQIAKSEAVFKKENYTAVQKRVKEIDESFKLAVTVLGQEVLFSKLLTQMGTAIPSGAVLTGLTINQTQGGIDISAESVDYATATQIQVNLADPENKIFEKADIVSIECQKDDQAAVEDPYPCKVTLRALFADDNPFLFINSKGKRQ